MSFTGSTPREAKIILCNLIKNAKSKEVYIGCSGNFSIDRLMGETMNVHSNDVSIYSKLISDILLGTDTELEVIHPLLEDIFDRWTDSRYKKLIQIMYAMRLSAFIEQKNPYEVQMLDAWNTKAVEYYEDTIKKFEKGVFDFKIQSFDYCDFTGFLKTKRGIGVGISFPPTYKGGYEKMFKFVSESFKYKSPEYNIYDPKKAEETLREFLEEDENIFIFDRVMPSFSKWESGVIDLKGKKDLYVYSSVGSEKKYYFEKKTSSPESKIPVLDLDYEFTNKTKIKAEICLASEVSYFKSFYMANKVNYTSSGDFGIVFYADGKAFGFVSFSKMLSRTLETVFMQSDFVVNSHTERLSKLLIMLVKSHDVQRLIARKLLNYYVSVKTAVYTDKPISMKYRGVFELEKREGGKLMYRADFTGQNLKQIYNTWLEKQKK